MLWSIFLVTIVIWLLILKWQNRKIDAMASKIRSDLKEYPILGHVLHICGNDEQRMDGIKKLSREAIKHNGISKLKALQTFMTVIADPVDAEVVLKNCLEKYESMKVMTILTGNGSIFAPVPIWRPRRKIISPVFSPKNLNHFVTTFAEKSKIMMENLKKVCNTGPFSIWNYMTSFTMDAVCETNLGVQVNAQDNHDNELLNTFENILTLMARRIAKPWLYNDAVYRLTPSFKKSIFCRDRIWNFVDHIVDKKKKSLKMEEGKKVYSEETNAKKNFLTFLDMIINASGGKNGFSNLELREETVVILIAGTDTSATAASYFCMMMARYPDVQEKIHQELQQIYGDSTRPVVCEDLPLFKYLDAVIKETLRLYPPVPVIARKIQKDTVLPSGLTLVPGSGVLCSFWGIHRNPRYWGDDVEVFRPERFLEGAFKHPLQFMPFSHGPRNCLGYNYAMMSMKTVLATLLRSYRILPAKDVTENNNNSDKSHKMPSQNPIRLKFDIMMKDVDGFVVEIEERVK